MADREDAARSHERCPRLLALLRVLHEQRSITRQELLTHPNLAPYYGPLADRALRRDLAALAGRPFDDLPSPDDPAPAGLPFYASDIRYDRATRTVTLAASRFAPLSKEEAAVLAIVEQGLRGDPLLGSQVSNLLARLGYDIPQARTPSLQLGLATDYSAHLSTLRDICRAMNWNRAINFVYQSLQPDRKEYKGVDVIGLEIREGHYYLHGLLDDGATELHFRVDRIVPGSLTIHPRYGGARRKRWPKAVEVRYWLAPHLSARGVSQRLHEQQETPAEDGGVIVSGKAPSLFNAERLLLGYGPLARALYPPELCRKMAENARAMANLYAEMSPSSAPSAPADRPERDG